MIEWDEKYSTGVARLDEQHKTLFRFINRLSEDVLAGKPASAFDKTLEFLEEYAMIHFNEEESCMNRYKCPVSGKNKAAHSDFLEFYLAFEEKIRKEGFSYKRLAQLHGYVENWIIAHIMTIDTKLKPCIHAFKDVPASLPPRAESD
jgi:hemerythrin